jgi:hypothetical protein
VVSGGSSSAGGLATRAARSEAPRTRQLLWTPWELCGAVSLSVRGQAALAEVARSPLPQGGHDVGALPTFGSALSSSEPGSAARTRPLRSKPVTRGAGCGNPHVRICGRPGCGNHPGPPGSGAVREWTPLAGDPGVRQPLGDRRELLIVVSLAIPWPNRQGWLSIRTF